MTEEMNDIIVIEPEVPDPQRIEEERRAMKRCFSLCGWSTFTVTASMLAISVIVSIVFVILYNSGIDVIGFYNNNLLFFNEAFLALAIVFGLLVIARMPKAVPEKNKISVRVLLGITCICFFIGAVGNTIGNAWLSFWNGITGNDVTNELAEILESISPIQMLLCTVVLAPVLEELFFRKLLIDRLNRFGEFTAIVVSALFFGLFHQNFSQFFYAFGLGLVFGYLYCKTGSYLLTVSLHAIFNFIAGAIPSLLASSVLEFAEKIAELTEEQYMEILPSLLGDYGVPLLIYGIYLLIMGALNITGLVLFITNFKKVSINKYDSALTLAERRRAVFLNVGMIAAIALLFVLMIASLFPQ